MDQVQDFYPTPGTLSTCMYYTGLDPRNMKPIYVTTDPHEKAMQRALMQFDNSRNYHLVKEALLRENRLDLIGYGTGCLIAPRVNDYSLRKQLESYQRQQKPTVKEARGKGTGGKEKKHPSVSRQNGATPQNRYTAAGKQKGYTKKKR